MSRPGFTTVYHYRYWDEDARELRTSKWEATLECIRNGLGIPVIESGRQVPLSALDEAGRVIIAEPAEQLKTSTRRPA